MKQLIITLMLLALTAIACKKKKGEYCWNQAIYNGVVIHEWDNNSPASNKVQKFEDSCKCKVTTYSKCVPCDGQHTDINGNDFSCN